MIDPVTYLGIIGTIISAVYTVTKTYDLSININKESLDELHYFSERFIDVKYNKNGENLEILSQKVEELHEFFFHCYDYKNGEIICLDKKYEWIKEDINQLKVFLKKRNLSNNIKDRVLLFQIMYYLKKLYNTQKE